METKTFDEWLKFLPSAQYQRLSYDDKMIVKMRWLFAKGETNPSSITSKLWYLGFKEGRFTDIRKIAEYQYRLYCQEQAEKGK